MSQRTGNTGGYAKVSMMLHAIASIVSMAAYNAADRGDSLTRRERFIKQTRSQASRQVRPYTPEPRRRRGMRLKNIGGERRLWWP